MSASRTATASIGGLRRGRAGIIACILLCAASAAVRAQLPPIYDGIAATPAAVQGVAEFPRQTFLENIARDSRGRLFVTSYLEGRVYRIDAGRRAVPWAKVDGTIAGIALNPDGSALLSGWLNGKEPSVFMVDRRGAVTATIPLPDGQFPNGVVRLRTGRYLVADSYKGVIWQIDTASRIVAPWSSDERLARASSDDPTPGVNGLKLFRGALYASNTAKQLLVKVPITGDRPGTLEVVAERLGIDDFDFDDAGNLYGATHVYQSVIKRSTNGEVSVLAGVEQGMAGSTALVVVGNEAWVTTNGGMSLPPPGGVQPARVLKLTLPAREHRGAGKYR